MKKLTTLLLAVVLFAVSACSSNSSKTGKVVYTYNSSTTATPKNWNPHTWEMSGEDTMINYLSTPLFDYQVKDSQKLEYQVVYLAGKSIKDVTSEHQDDLTKFNAVLPEGKQASDVTEGYVFEIELNPEIKWQNGVKVNADTYIYSFKALLDPKMKNYRANNYYGGENAIAGAKTYFDQGGYTYTETSTPFSKLVLKDGAYFDEAGNELFFNSSVENSYLGVSVADLLENYNDGDYYVVTETYNSKIKESLTFDKSLKVDENVYNAFKEAFFTDGLKDELGDEELFSSFFYTRVANPSGFEFEDTVGVYKVDEYTIRFVCETQNELNYFIGSMTSPILVYEELYEKLKNTTGELVTTTYGTSVETSFSYGPYLLTNFEKDKNFIFEKNGEYFLYEKDSNGRYVGTSNFEVDGQKVEIYQADCINTTVIENPDSVKQAFLKGELDDWTPTADDLPTYTLSDQIYKADETYTLRLFFCDKLDKLKEIDATKGNTNSVVLSNENFRKAFSLAIDRSEFITATAAFKPAFGVMNYLYYYDGYNDPTSIYRNTDQAKQALVELYDVKYGDGTPYATLDAAHDSLTGYNLTQAKELMQKAYEELSASGVYTGGDIFIRIAYSPSEITTTQLQQIELFNKFINAATEGTGFGKITFEAVGKVTNRYDETAKGNYAVGIGAWGGAAFYPFTMFKVYCDPSYVSIHEAGSWDPSTYTFTLNVKGQEVTKTAQEWSNTLAGTGVYATESNEVKLSILAQLEKELLNLYHMIPLATYTNSTLYSYKVNPYTKDYNIFYGFGGIQLYQFQYTDAEWSDFVKNNELSYE